MFIGHYAVALGAKRATPRVSLGTLLIAAQFLDLLWPVLLLAGVEHVRIAPGITRVTPLDFYDYPISHSLLTSIAWGIGFGLVYLLIRRGSPSAAKNALILSAAVVSHWVLDWIVHRPDLPITPTGHHYVGRGLWNSLAATIAIESALFVAGIALYLRTTKPRDGTGRIAFWAFIIVLYAIYLGNLFGAPPPSTRAIAWLGNAQWLMVAWAYWLDAHRATALDRRPA
jgi:FtsH-binding integral membrane protein